jgi:hypothetical protein
VRSKLLSVDDEWAEEVLLWWLENAPKACATGNHRNLSGLYSFGHVHTREANALREREDQTRRVVAKINGLSKLPQLISPLNGGNIEILTGVETVKYALGRLRTEAETRARLGTTAPTMAADALHPTIWGAASSLWSDGHHGQAVQRAATFLNAHIQDLTGRHDLSDNELMKQVFSLETASSDQPRLRWPGADNDKTVRSMRVGILNFSQGAFSAIRNPATHSTEDLPRQVALEQLATLSTLARWVDGCELAKA